MEISEEKIENVAVISISGRVDSAVSSELETKFISMVDQGAKKVAVNLADLDFISSAGLRVFLLLTKKLKNLEGKIALFAMRETIKSVFDLSGFSTIIPIYATKEEALASLK